MLDPLHPTDAERAANAIVSLRNDEIMRHMSLHFHDQFPASLPRSQPAPAGLPNAGDYTNTAASAAKGI